MTVKFADDGTMVAHLAQFDLAAEMKEAEAGKPWRKMGRASRMAWLGSPPKSLCRGTPNASAIRADLKNLLDLRPTYIRILPAGVPNASTHAKPLPRAPHP